MKNIFAISLSNLIIGRCTKTIYKFLKHSNIDFSTIKNENNFINILKNLNNSVKKKIRPYTENEIYYAIKKAEEILVDSIKSQVKIVSIYDEVYPLKLKQIEDPPIVIYIKGNYNNINNRSISIIGKRQPSKKGEFYSYELAKSFAKKGFNIISGLAIGCDREAHKGAIDADGKTIAILPCGINLFCPKVNSKLAEKILDKGGCLISEYPLSTSPQKSMYVKRNRIISGLSDGVVVIETGLKGGSMHTVNFSIKQRRELACVKYSDEYIRNYNLEGNKKIISELGAFPLEKNKDIDYFVKKIRNKYTHNNLNLFSEMTLDI